MFERTQVELFISSEQEQDLKNIFETQKKKNIKINSVKLIYQGRYPSGEKISSALLEQLSKNSYLREIHLSCNCRFQGDTSQGEVIRDIMTVINKNIAITHLTITYFSVGHDVANEFANFLKHNKSLRTLTFIGNGLDFQDCHVINEALKENTFLEELIIDDKLEFTHEELEIYQSVCGSKPLTTIADIIAHNKKIQTLSITMADASLASCSQALQTNQFIKELTLKSAKASTLDAMASVISILRHNPRLEMIDISGLKFAAFSNRAAVNEKQFDFFKELAFYPIKKLNIAKHTLGDENISSLLEFLRANKSIIDINLKGCDLCYEKIFSIMEIIKENIKLEAINLEQNLFGASCCKFIVDTLVENISLKDLNLYSIIYNDEYLKSGMKYEDWLEYMKIKKLLTNNAEIQQVLANTFFVENPAIQNLLIQKALISAESTYAPQKVNHVMVRSTHSLEDLCLNAVHKAMQNEKISLQAAQKLLPAELFNQVNPNAGEDNCQRAKPAFKLTKFKLFQPLESEQSSTETKTIYWKLVK